MASADDINSTLQGITRNIGNEVLAVQGIATAIINSGSSSVVVGQAVVTAILGVATAILSVFPRINGTFTLSNTTVTVVTQPGISASGFPLFTPTNATAALTLRTAGLYLSAVTAGVSFSLSTQTGAPIGTETFKYIVFNPS